MSKFKVGDKVYCPVHAGGEVCTLASNFGGFEGYVVRIAAIGESFTDDGFHYKHHKCPSLFHATKENHAALSTLFPEIEFEQPPLTNNEIVQNMLKEGKPVMCYLSDDSYDMAVFKGADGLVASYDGEYHGFDAGGSFWKYVVPMNYSDVMSKIGFIQETVNE